MRARPRVRFLGVAFDPTSLDSAVQHVLGRVAESRGGWVLTPNTSIVRQLHDDDQLGFDADDADLVLLDGRPIKWLSSLERIDLGDVVTGADLFPRVMQELPRNTRVLMVGGAPGVVAEAARRAAGEGFSTVGCHYPPPGFGSSTESLRAEVERAVQPWATPPDLVVVALPFPLQVHATLALQSHWPNAYFLNVGAAVSFWVGDVHRSPRWMSALGLEWLYRLKQEPTRLARRYLRDDLPFLARRAVGLLFRSGA